MLIMKTIITHISCSWIRRKFSRTFYQSWAANKPNTRNANCLWLNVWVWHQVSPLYINQTFQGIQVLVSISPTAPHWEDLLNFNISTDAGKHGWKYLPAYYLVPLLGGWHLGGAKLATGLVLNKQCFTFFLAFVRLEINGCYELGWRHGRWPLLVSSLIKWVISERVDLHFNAI